MESPVALVTGASRRIGAEICRHLHGAGYRVLVHCRDSVDDADELARALNAQRPDTAQVVQADLGNAAELQALVTASLSWGRLDLLVNNASSFYPTPMGEATYEHWDELLASNLKAPFFLCQALSEALKATGGAVINIADIHGQRPLAGHSIYSIAKAANIMLTKSLALELAPEVRVNGITPGAMLWPENQQQPDESLLSKIPLASLGGAEAIAQAVLYLASKHNYVTGHLLTVDGGRSLHQ